MYKFSVLFLLIVANCFAQKSTLKELTVKEMDSISQYESCIQVNDLSENTTVSRSRVENGNEVRYFGIGNSTIKAHFFMIDDKYQSLSKSEKKTYDYSKNCILLRADYQDKIDFKEVGFDTTLLYFYYKNDALFYIKYEAHSKYHDEEEKVVYHNFFSADIDKEFKDNEGLKMKILFLSQIVSDQLLKK